MISKKSLVLAALVLVTSLASLGWFVWYFVANSNATEGAASAVFSGRHLNPADDVTFGQNFDLTPFHGEVVGRPIPLQTGVAGGYAYEGVVGLKVYHDLERGGWIIVQAKAASNKPIEAGEAVFCTAYDSVDRHGKTTDWFCHPDK